MITIVDFVGASVTERGVPASAVVKPLDVANEVASSLGLGRVNRAIYALVFEHGEETFGLTIVPTHAGAAHGGAHAQADHQGAERG